MIHSFYQMGYKMFDLLWTFNASNSSYIHKFVMSRCIAHAKRTITKLDFQLQSKALFETGELQKSP